MEQGESSNDSHHPPSSILNSPPSPRRITVPHILAAICLLFWLTAVALRLTVRDRWPGLAVLFYATPLALLTVSALLFALLLFLRKHRRAGIAALVAALLCGGWWWQTSFYFHSAPTHGETLRVLFWNCQRGRHGWKEVAQQIHDLDAPVIGLVESQADFKAQKRFWVWEFLEYNVATPGGGIALLTRGTILQSQLIPLGNDSRCGEFQIEIEGQAITVLIVDIKSNPFISRRQPLDHLSQVIANHGDEPLIVMGDFNTPTDSCFLDPLRRQCDNAFETAGYGSSATWPLPAPVLSLDQVWTGGPIKAASCRHLWTTRSDHRQVVTEISFLPNAQP